MKSTMILSYIAASQRRRLVYPVLLLLTIIFLLSRTSMFFYLQMQTLPQNQVINTSEARSSRYLRAPVSTLYYTGQDYWNGGQLTGHFYYALLDETCQYYVVKASAGIPAAAILEDYTVTGRVDLFGDEFDTLNAGMADKLDWTASDLRSISSIYYVNETAYFNRREIFLTTVLLILFVLTAIILIRTVVYWFVPRLTPAYRKLAKYGNPEDILMDAEHELNQNSLIRTRNMVLTEDYLIEFSEDLSAIIPLKSILWTYDHAAMRYHYKGKRLSYTIHVVTVYGDEYNLKQKSAEDVQVIYHELTSRFPDYFYGYSREHQQMVRHIIKEGEKDF